jgi:sugar phosphate isomerase/epimerase
MTIKILCPTWGHESWPIDDFLQKVKQAGYDGVDTWIPDDAAEKKALLDGLQKHGLLLVAHQHQANGNTFEEFKRSFVDYLHKCAAAQPLLINSHTGRDYFSFEQNLVPTSTNG